MSGIDVVAGFSCLRLTPLAKNLPFPVIYLRGRLSLWYREPLGHLFRKASLLNVSTDNRHA